MQFKKGDKVQWIKKIYQGPEYTCTGSVESTKMSTFGSSKKGEGLRILIQTPANLKDHHTFVSAANVKKL